MPDGGKERMKTSHKSKEEAVRAIGHPESALACQHLTMMHLGTVVHCMRGTRMSSLPDK